MGVDTYTSVTNKNIKWNIGKIENIDKLNLDAIRTYESKAQIESNIGLISMSEYMEASINQDCGNGLFASCTDNNYLYQMLKDKDAWTLTTTTSSVAYINQSGLLAYETDLTNAHHSIYYTINVTSTEKNGDGSLTNPFIIELES